MKHWLACVALWLPLTAAAAPCDGWPQWQAFSRHFVSDGGRVLDRNQSGQPTTSEGQGYAMLFALVANDRPAFDRLLAWTRDNLAQGDLSAHLPAWLWGARKDGSWGVIDDNSAADADLWLAYDLIEAGRLWHEPRYDALGKLLALRILREESTELPGFGPMLLPGPAGFRPAPDRWRLNPSYLPLQLVTRVAAVLPDSGWPAVLPGTRRLLRDSAPAGFAPDWVDWQVGHGWQPDRQTAAVGSYNAIRVYLWLGMLAPDSPDRAALLAHYRPMAERVARDGQPPEQVDSRDGRSQGAGPVGFSLALLPFLQAAGRPEALQTQLLRQVAQPLTTRPDAYYDHALALFGQGWYDKRYAFAADGRLLPQWEGACSAASSH